MKFERGDMVIIKRYYDEDKTYIRSLDDLEDNETTVYNVMINKTPLKITHIRGTNYNIKFPYTIRLEHEGDINCCDEELEFAKITNWKERLK